MSSRPNDEELQKAKFYYDAVLKLEELSQKSYERTNTKINIFIGVLSTVIPILTGIGYVVLSNTFAVSFFVFYLISLSIFVWALAKCVQMLSPTWFTCIEIGEFMKEYDKKPLSYIIFKVSSKWESIIRRNFERIGSFAFGLQQIVRLIIVGLIALIFALVQLAIQYYLIDFFTQTEQLRNIMSANEWRSSFLGICFLIFVPLVIYILKHTSTKDDNTIKVTQTNETEKSN
jgi:hypothetical protein